MRELDELVARIIKGRISVLEATVEPPQGVNEKPLYDDANDFFDAVVNVMGGHIIHQSDIEPIAVGQYHDSRFFIYGDLAGKSIQVQVSLAKGSPYVMYVKGKGENFATGGMVELTLYGLTRKDSDEVEPNGYSYSFRHGNEFGKWSLYLGSPRHSWRGIKHAVDEAHAKLPLLNDASEEQLKKILYDRLPKKWQFDKPEALPEALDEAEAEPTRLANLLHKAVLRYVENPAAHLARPLHNAPHIDQTPRIDHGETFFQVVVDPFMLMMRMRPGDPEAVKGHEPIFPPVSVRVGYDRETRNDIKVNRGGRHYTFSIYEVNQIIYLKSHIEFKPNQEGIDWWFVEVVSR